jgi:hypothetical protein
MHFIAFIIAFTAVATAAPEVRRYPPVADITISEADDACGNNLELSCCNKETDQAADHGNVRENPGVVGGVLDGLSLFDQCSQLSVATLIGVQDLLKFHCTGKVACCQRSPSIVRLCSP